MSTLSIRIPDSIHNQARELAKREGISINQLVTTALAEKMSAIMTVDYLEARAKRGERTKFDRVLGKVKAGAPMPGDELSR